jgi:alpha-beta hydrolase superfamily lysophospholipase
MDFFIFNGLMHMKIYLLLISVLMTFPECIRAQDMSLFGYWTYYSDAENSLYKSHCDQAFRMIEERRTRINLLDTRDQWIARRNFISDKLKDILNLYPARTPLNPKINGIIQRDGYRIEKLIYESQPGYYVTGAIYIPDGLRKKAPAIFYACGHSVEGFRANIYQHIIINLVKKGFVVLTIDPMGQGERYEYWDKEANRPTFPVPDHEHSYAGAQCLVTGYSVASHFIMDVIRGLDYMVTRPEIDPGRIGMTGRSGGGNLTAYVGAIDDRILAAAPECYITDYEHLFKSIGPQCAEQNLYRFFQEDLNHADFIVARAPKPTLIIGTTRDFFSIQGTLKSFTESKRIYDMLGAGDKLTMVQDDAIHTSTQKNREAMYAFFQKYLDNPGSQEDLNVSIPDPETLKVTESGQVAVSLKGETIFSLNNRLSRNKWEKLISSREEDMNHIRKTLADAQELTGFEEPADYGEAVFSGRYRFVDYALEKYLVKGSGKYMLPVIYLYPAGFNKNKIILYFHTEGMEHVLQQDTLVQALMKQGYGVLLSDLPGTGCMGPGYLKGDSYIKGISYNQWFAAVLAGKSHVALRSQDILRIVNFIRQELAIDAGISAMSEGPLAVDLLHASAFKKEIGSICLINPFLSFKNFTATRFYQPEYVPFLVAGTAGRYDLADLMASLMPGRILILNPRQADGLFASPEKVREELDYPHKIYLREKLDSRFIVISNAENKDPVEEILSWHQAQQ